MKKKDVFMTVIIFGKKKTALQKTVFKINELNFNF
jgi:hypothetical protein